MTFQPAGKGLLLCACAIFVFASCQKLLDYVHDHPGDGDADLKTCNIKKITVVESSLEGFDTIHYVFSYNLYGNPVSIATDQPGTGNPNSVFRYDKYNRLSQRIQPYSLAGNGLYETFSKYYYNSANQVILDSTYIFGVMSGDTALPATDHHAFTQYTYDAKNRMSQAAVYTINYGVITGPQTYTFNYNSSGNRTGPAYDDKLNLNRTNRIWMFLARDYSVNNPFVATQYNLNDLPLVIPNATLQIVPGSSGKINVEYACP